MISLCASKAAGFGLSARVRRFALLLTALGGLGGAYTPTPVMAEPATQAASAVYPSQLRQQTTELAQLMARYRQADENEQANLLNEIQSLVAQRKDLMLKSLADNPATVVQAALPAQAALGMPNSVQTQLEQLRTHEGQLLVAYEDYPDGSHKLRHFLNTTAGEQLELHFTGDEPALQSGGHARVKGIQIDNNLVLDQSALQMEALNGSTSSTTTSGVTVQPNTFGEQKTLVMLVNFQDAPTNQPWTVDQARSMVFTNVSNYFLEDSYQQTWLSGDVLGWFTVAVDSTNCDTTTIAQQADAAATNAGANLSAYQHKIYIFPNTSACGWTGMGTVGGSPSQSWINGSMQVSTIGHEMGHNFGLQHSHALECGATTLGTSCQSIEYGDRDDIMGNYVAGHMAPFQKLQLGWLGYGSSPAITTVSASGTYTLTPYEVNDGGVKALRIPMGVDPTSGLPKWYYIEYRQAIGSDSFLAGNTNVLNGVVVRTGVDGDSRTSYLLDMTPNSNSIGYYDWSDHALASGMTYVDSNAGVTITTDWTNGTQASVTVELGPQTCQHAKPAIALTPVQSAWVAPGTPVSYTMTLTNSDNSSCSSSQFNLQAQAPTGWTASFAQTALTLAPGQSASTTLSVTSPTGTADGYYNINLTASNATVTGYDASATVTYVVSAAADTAPVAVADTATTADSTAVTIAVLSNDYDPDGQALKVVSVTTPAHGTATINSNGTIQYVPVRRYAGTDSFSYQISDGIKTASATVTVTVGSSTTTTSTKGKK